MAKSKGNKVKVPHGQPIPEGMDLDTSDYVNEVGPHDDDLTTHPEYHEDKLYSNVQPLQERIDVLKECQGNAPEEVTFERRVDSKSGIVTALLYFPDGDRYGGQGKTTDEAVTALETKLNRLFPAEDQS